MHKCSSGHVLEPKSFKKQYICDGCKEPGYGPRYRCEPCNYDLHDSCMLTSNSACHHFYKDKTFVFVEKLPTHLGTRRCDACTQEIFGFAYHSYKEGWDLHPCCLDLQPKLCAEGIEFKLQKKMKSKCVWCSKKTLGDTVSGVKGWAYVSECKEYHFHVRCLVLSMLEGLKREGASEREDVPLQLHAGRNKESPSKYWRIMAAIFKIVASILLGDPATALASSLPALLLN